jgi:hypothetical protein
MRRIVISEAMLRQRRQIQEQRDRYYQARAEGLSRDEASAVANGFGQRKRIDVAESPDERVTITQPDPIQEPGTIEIPDDWKFLSYLPRIRGGVSLRGLATKFSDQPINSAAEAVAAIEAELARRG